ncbi:tetratricopeptide repeat protein [Ancylostoma caninum]|uniref:Tetratricopeptide repeat protein 30 n=1 Tax=Ancylostoma caninum TaxID=29170 RepID=A0A368G726_ANCCA|nr:tetratricopeptide repeat protein [Ancylostoma caninum]
MANSQALFMEWLVFVVLRIAIKEGKYTEVIRVLQYEVQRAPSNRAALSLLGYCYYYCQVEHSARFKLWASAKIRTDTLYEQMRREDPSLKDNPFCPILFTLTRPWLFHRNNPVKLLSHFSNRKLGKCEKPWRREVDFINAVDAYAQLAQLFPNFPEYKLYHAQSLYNAFMLQEALQVVSTIEEQHLLGDVIKLESAIKYREEDLNNARILVEQYPADDPDTEMNLACLDYKDGDYDKAQERFNNASSIMGYQPELAYAIALCHYRKKEYPQALKFITDIVDRGIKDHPELGVGMVTEGMDLRSVGNTMKLHETSLVEALNLKFAVEYKLKNFTAAQEALTDMPPRSEEELDAVTLHNQALIGIDTDPSDGFAKLQYLLSQNPFPPETFANLLLLYCKYEYYDLAADVLAENAHLTFKYLTQYQFDYLDALINLQTSPDEAYAKFDAMANDQMNELRNLTKKVQEIRQSSDETTARKAVEAFDETLELYLPVLMSQAKIYWDKGDYARVEKIFRKSVEFCSEHDTWKLNVAHTLFMQEQKFKEAAGFYEPIVSKNFVTLLDVSAIILANLCVCYIMTNQNEEAEELMRKVEREEDEARELDENRKIFHVCIINLVIGTLYCSKGNFEFGISRVIKAMEPQERKLGTDTWYYAKRCLLATIETMSKHLVVIRDSVVHECLKFLDRCEVHGRGIPTIVDGPLMEGQVDSIKNTVTYEARLLKSLLLQVINN